eukprot:scaffold11275_cov108-Isochrysis_galbana.AAC.9
MPNTRASVGGPSRGVNCSATSSTSWDALHSCEPGNRGGGGGKGGAGIRGGGGRCGSFSGTAGG